MRTRRTRRERNGKDKKASRAGEENFFPKEEEGRRDKRTTREVKARTQQKGEEE